MIIIGPCPRCGGPRARDGTCGRCCTFVPAQNQPSPSGEPSPNDLLFAGLPEPEPELAFADEDAEELVG